MPVRRAAAAAAAVPSASEYTSASSTPVEDEAPTTRSSVSARRGWPAAKETIDSTRTAAFAEDWVPPEGETIVKFLEDEPFASVGMHWIREKSEGKRSFYCPPAEDGSCPLCAVGHGATAQIFFNVVPVANSNGAITPDLKALKAGPMLTGLIRDANESKQGPLSRHYWLIRKSVVKNGKGSRTNYSVSAIKARDLAEDWELDPETLDFSKFEPHTEDILRFEDADTLQGIVDEYLLVED